MKELGLARGINAQDAKFILIPVLARGGSVADDSAEDGREVFLRA